MACTTQAMQACSGGLTRPSRVLSAEGESMNEVVIRHVEQDDDQPIISVVDARSGRRVPHRIRAADRSRPGL